MLAATLLSLGVVFLAELGDRSQVVLPGVAVAAFLVHGVAVTIGQFLGATLPARPLAFASADETIPTTHEPRFAITTGPGYGSAAPLAWSWPMAWRSVSGRC
jgi:Ca2+/H+ antiporter, TMEM165/GDT1 family